MPREFHRSRRVEEAIQRALSIALASKIRDPRLNGIGVTHVSVSRDVSVAKVYYSMLSGEPLPKDVAQAFAAATGFFRSAVASELRLRQVPELRFYPDEALDRARSLENLIAEAVKPPAPLEVDPDGT
jgi:ribosome-binding factor A